ncbi:MAG TPA: tRNA (adenosine(37)-N6)-threonylcarbamoyltransferase complex transferase subunit TsaD [Candidatus Xenobia bacterium]|jgi:N6-L-threonylcarbamoyladenine synthase
MITLAVETSCDETSVAVLEDGHRLRANLVASQIELHRTYGGVVPELACRKHSEVINALLQEAKTQSGVAWKDIGLVASTRGPGLVGALVVGMASAKALSLSLGVPLVGVNHLEGHVYANFLEHPELPFPILCLLVSGGHTILLWMESHGVYRTLGETRDDAAGEAFDKVARVLGLGYPGGPVVDRLAQAGRSTVPFPRALRGQPGYDFSFSGLKTAVLNFHRKDAGQTPMADVCASFQEAVVDALVMQVGRALEAERPATVVMAGGVACNSRLRQRMSERCSAAGVPLVFPSPAMCTDNAAMIACAGYHRYRSGQFDTLDLEVTPSLSL